MGSSYVKLDQKLEYKNVFSNQILNKDYVGIGNLKHETEKANFENKFKYELLSVEDKLYAFDLDISQTQYLINGLRSGVPITKLSKICGYSDKYEEIFNEKWTNEQILAILEKQVSLSD